MAIQNFSNWILNLRFPCHKTFRKANNSVHGNNKGDKGRNPTLTMSQRNTRLSDILSRINNQSSLVTHYLPTSSISSPRRHLRGTHILEGKQMIISNCGNIWGIRALREHSQWKTDVAHRGHKDRCYPTDPMEFQVYNNHPPPSIQATANEGGTSY
ncbi:F-box protein [Dorcoceras hygrometricum]|uniref:F-box protein n=1 Tax=Dorcoceras hygrometricum TaxID=472368 RepID=A0A2Z7C8A1_9LAMI|nr:F-box protein [Dorcoceras hygrometricum]